ncbi:MAG: hypothetical protein ABI668_05080 [Sphingorhabdus sp.]
MIMKALSCGLALTLMTSAAFADVGPGADKGKRPKDQGDNTSVSASLRTSASLQAADVPAGTDKGKKPKDYGDTSAAARAR